MAPGFVFCTVTREAFGNSAPRSSEDDDAPKALHAKRWGDRDEVETAQELRATGAAVVAAWEVSSADDAIAALAGEEFSNWDGGASEFGSVALHA